MDHPDKEDFYLGTWTLVPELCIYEEAFRRYLGSIRYRNGTTTSEYQLTGRRRMARSTTSSFRLPKTENGNLRATLGRRTCRSPESILSSSIAVHTPRMRRWHMRGDVRQKTDFCFQLFKLDVVQMAHRSVTSRCTEGRLQAMHDFAEFRL
jgi:hypothetical protein